MSEQMKLFPFPLAYDAEEQRLYFADGDVEPTVAWMDDNASAETNEAHALAIVAAVNAALGPQPVDYFVKASYATPEGRTGHWAGTMRSSGDILAEAERHVRKHRRVAGKLDIQVSAAPPHR